MITDSLADPKGLRFKLIRHKNLLNRVGRRTWHGRREDCLGKGHRRWSVCLLHPHQNFRATLELRHDGAPTGMNSQIFFCHALNQICMIKTTSDNPPKWYTLLKMTTASLHRNRLIQNSILTSHVLKIKNKIKININLQ